MLIVITDVTIIYLFPISGSNALGFFSFSNNDWEGILIDEDEAKVFLLTHCLN